eukprot:6268581-Prymnesium_polylepis.1
MASPCGRPSAIAALSRSPACASAANLWYLSFYSAFEPEDAVSMSVVARDSGYNTIAFMSDA